MSVNRCANCGHAIYRHYPDDMELCRIEACPCPGFLTAAHGKAMGIPPLIDEAVAMVRFAHHEHAFGDEHCTPANCRVAEWLAARPGIEGSVTP